MGLTKFNKGKCWNCGSWPGSGGYDTHVLDWASDGHGEEVPVWRCMNCGELVPTETWERYQQTGDVVVRRRRKK